MPYVSQETRQQLDAALTNLMETIDGSIGAFTYAVTMLAIDAIKHNSFSAMALVLGALESAKLELYRRRIAVYEDRKMREAGDLDWRIPED